MNSLQATDDKHLILEDQFEKEVNAKRPLLHSERWYNFWSNRYLCVQAIHDQKFWRFDIFDLLTNESKPVRFQKSSGQFRFVYTHFLNHKFMVIVEKVSLLGGLNCVNLVKLNWESGIFETLEHFELEAFMLYIIADPLNQSKFVLRSSVFGNPIHEYQECKLIKGKVEFGIVYRLSGVYDQCLNNKLIKVDRLGRKLRVTTYNMIDKQEKSFETEACSDRVELMYYFPCSWVVDRLYFAVRFQDFGNYGLMWSDEKTRHWNILDFSTTMEIKKLHFFNDSLIVYTKQIETENGVFKSSVKIYGIAIGRPKSLRQQAWLTVIRNLKRKNHPDPYKEATRYLPLNTDLRPYWFEDVEEGAPDEQGNDVGDEAVQAKFADLSV